MTDLNADQTRALVREHYARISTKYPCCTSTCCGPEDVDATPGRSLALGYSPGDLAAAPDGADLGLGCGNPTAIAALSPGETVLDLGAGGGFDCFLAARAVGPTGHVIGVDMTAEMVSRARANTSKLGAANVEFRLGEIEHLPVADRSVDVVLSNCVINLSPDKRAVFAEAFRVLRPGGRLAISDVVATAPVPPALRAQAAAFASCIAGATLLDDVKQLVEGAGFVDVTVAIAPHSAEVIESWLAGASAFIASALIEARRPAREACCP